jgi:BirA family biotin operon repressor/biotin-[acetyl-CoA-carboxylase] ligase
MNPEPKPVRVGARSYGRGVRPALDVERLRATAGSRWSRIDVVAETESTNADLLADRDAPDASVLVAEYQAAGRGRFARGWVSPPRAGLTFSVLLRPAVERAHWTWLPLLAGVALAEAVDAATGVRVALKWPNDLLAAGDGRKLAGILVQTRDDAAVLGVGVNVATEADELPADTATSLKLCGADVDRTELLAAILRRLDAWLAAWTAHGSDALAAVYRARCATLGAAVRVSVVGGAPVEGIAVDVDAAGRLVVRTPDGARTLGAGDVEHLRAHPGEDVPGSPATG